MKKVQIINNDGVVIKNRKTKGEIKEITLKNNPERFKELYNMALAVPYTVNDNKKRKIKMFVESPDFIDAVKNNEKYIVT